MLETLFWYKVFVHWKLKLLSFHMDFVLIVTDYIIIMVNLSLRETPCTYQWVALTCALVEDQCHCHPSACSHPSVSWILLSHPQLHREHLDLLGVHGPSVPLLSLQLSLGKTIYNCKKATSNDKEKSCIIIIICRFYNLIAYPGVQTVRMVLTGPG